MLNSIHGDPSWQLQGPSEGFSDQPPDRFAVVDLFSGAGGLAEGFRQAGYSILAGLDSDPDAAATFARNFPEAHTICGDIRDEAVREQLRSVLPLAKVLVGGPPCQAFSQVRNHSRVIDDPRNSLYREFVSALRVARPLAFLMENVGGLEQMGARAQITQDLELDGEYRVQSQFLDAADFGVPQTRKRLLFLGFRADLKAPPPAIAGSGASAAIALERLPESGGVFRYRVAAEETLRGRTLAAALANPEDATVVSVADALADLSLLPVGHRDDEIPYAQLPEASSAYQRKLRIGAGKDISNVQVPRINRDTALRLAAIPDGGNHRDLAKEYLDRYLTGQRWGQDNGTGLLSRRHFYAYRRLHPGIWAWTLNTKADSVYHFSHYRALAVREFARLQSFPDRFIFTTDVRKGPLPGRHDGGPAHSRYRQVGNAVPPLLARAVAERFLAVLQARPEVQLQHELMRPAFWPRQAPIQAEKSEQDSGRRPAELAPPQQRQERLSFHGIYD